MTVVVPNIINHARSTKEVGKLFGQPSKLTPKQCLLNFILYFKHDNVTMQDTFMWNWFKTSICDAALFILPCINEAIVDDIQWSILEERVTLTRRIRNLLGCIRFIDITLVEIFKLWNNVMHWTWLNVRKKIYSANKTVNCWQPRYFHLHQHWIPQVIPWCNDVMAFQSLCQLA